MMMSQAVVKPRVTEHMLHSPTELACKVAELTTETLSRALLHKNRASLVVSGGRTSRVILPQLARSAVSWARVTVSLADDRWVPPSSAESNERLVSELFLRAGAEAAQLFPLFVPDVSVEEGCRIRALALPPEARPFDVVLLGMGEDGHFASIFPSTSAAILYGQNDDLFVPGRAPVPPVARISMSPRLLLDSRRIILVFQGEEKRVLYRRALLEGALSDLPVRALLERRSDAELHVVWSPW